jgi:hypothetical protein
LKWLKQANKGAAARPVNRFWRALGSDLRMMLIINTLRQKTGNIFS